MPEIRKIVITGGPCGGKTTALSRIEKHFTGLGYHVVFVNETATEMMSNGSAPWIGENVNFQNALMHLQYYKEGIYSGWANHLDYDKVLLVCDRGLLDNKAYMTEEEFESILTIMQTNEIELRDNYDAVFHLVTAANGAEEFYTTSNNENRIESIDQAITLDNKIISAWTGHPHFRVIDNNRDFELKIARLISEIADFLGTSEPFEVERRFLIEYPDLDILESIPNCSKVEIIQTYLNTPTADTEVHVRQRGNDENYILTETTIRKVSDTDNIETERRISQKEYLALIMNADTTLRQIRKSRYCLSYAKQYLEIDIHPFWSNQAILSVELSSEGQQIVFPEFISVIDEITGDESYTNRALAEGIPIEIN
ncbi:MAG: AAA family ATPase [Oscillospiraceae bacterium]|nr:AAA family ATPase [Oscillospiraceae bacterium]